MHVLIIDDDFQENHMTGLSSTSNEDIQEFLLNNPKLLDHQGIIIYDIGTFTKFFNSEIIEFPFILCFVSTHTKLGKMITKLN